jgi:uncharacterized protein (TIGR02246 family)
MRLGKCIVVSTILLSSLACGLCAAQEGKEASAQRQPAPADARAEDRAAIRKAIESFAKTFEARDAKSLVAHFTTEGEFQNVHGARLRGREALGHAFAEFFSRTPEVKAEVDPESLRFLSTNSAIDEGSVSVQRGPTEPATKARYSALVVREDGAWRLALLSESPGGHDVSIADLGWLIGEWESTGGGSAEIQTTYSWVPGKKFIHMEFTKKETHLALSGTQIIGLDPATGMIHSWTFEADGGIGEADWHRDGDHWVLDAAGTLTDGRTLAETNVLRRIDDDTFTWQSVNRLLDGAELADLAPVKVTRIKTKQ